MAKTITLNNGVQSITFTKKTLGNLYNEGRNLADVYDNCSGAKWSSYNFWSDFFATGFKNGKFTNYDMYITSHNTFQYSLAGYVNMDGQKIRFKITSCNNYYEEM